MLVLMMLCPESLPAAPSEDERPVRVARCLDASLGDDHSLFRCGASFGCSPGRKRREDSGEHGSRNRQTRHGIGISIT